MSQETVLFFYKNEYIMKDIRNKIAQLDGATEYTDYISAEG